MTVVKIIELLIALQRVIDLIIEAQVKRTNAADLEQVRLLVEQAKMARTEDDKIKAAKELRDAFKTKR
ncbi:MAG: hypothetical protein IPJ84_19110 [Bdellovibrionales bacterium]|nr:hypothetical protein [Bdellovibrionales bacterium]MBK7892880.1 hypothetical protein [Bdellovibrionales bacterium]